VKLNSFLNSLEWVANKIVRYFMVALLIIVCTNIFFRYVLSSSFSWAEETARFLLIWITFMSATTMMRRKEHFNVVILKEGTSLRTFFIYFYRIVFIALGLIMLIQGTRYTYKMAFQLSPATHISMGFIYIVIPIAGLYFIIYALTTKFK